MPGSTLLSGLKVVDMTSVLFGPYCTQSLADMGADVVKIEPKTGDIFRYAGKPAKTRGMGPGHMTANRGKRSVAWDMKSELGIEATKRLIAKSDIFIHNIRADAIARLGLSFDYVKTIKPDIVYVHCLGFGADGPYAGRPAYDDLIQALSGFASLSPIVLEDDQPRFVPMTIADKVSGLHAIYATLAAVIRRDRTGEAVHAEVPMLECTTHFLLEDHFSEATFDPPTGPHGLKNQLDPARMPFRTKDGWLAIAPYSDRGWVKVFTVMKAEDELENERLIDKKARFHNFGYMASRINAHLSQRETSYWIDEFTKADLPAAPVNTMGQLKDDPHLAKTEFFQRREHPTEGGYWEMQPPVRFRGVPEEEISHAQHIGEDTNAVLKELGLEPKAD
ncbi:MAG: CoA transferase [Henriciella sp.]